MGRASRAKAKAREQKAHQQFGEYASQGKWLEAAKIAKSIQMKFLDENFKPIELESIEEFAEHIEKQWTGMKKANQGFPNI